MNRVKRRLCLCVVALAFGSLPVAPPISAQRLAHEPGLLDATYIPTPASVVTAMLRMADVGAADVVYDLGSGDGRIVIAAVKEFGAARGVGIDLDPERVLEANENARRAGVADRVEFRRQNLFETDLRPASVVTLYMGQAVNLELRPKLQAELKPGSRIVSHVFGMGDWTPVDSRTVNGRPVFLWTIPDAR
jgi:SAM-dependent methyltransferase